MKIVINNTGGYKVVIERERVTVSRRQRDNWQKMIDAAVISPASIKGVFTKCQRTM